MSVVIDTSAADTLGTATASESDTEIAEIAQVADVTPCKKRGKDANATFPLEVWAAAASLFLGSCVFVAKIFKVLFQ